jgi:teichuronic acid biosynthesis glycosyltransferase TuaG
MNSDVSVVIPYFKAEDTIVRALNSVKAQTHSVKEVIIVNDGCDFVLLTEKVAEFTKYLHIILIDLAVNSGAANARNIGVRDSSGQFIAFLDADDVWHPEKISIQYDCMCRTGAFLTCHGYIFNLNMHSFAAEDSVCARKLRRFDFLWRNHIFTPTVMVVKERFIDFDNRLTRSEDLKCWISNFLNGEFVYLSMNLAGGYKRAVGESGLSASYSLMHKEYISAWRYLFNEGVVGYFYYFAAIAVEYFKYPLRLSLARFRRR